MKPAERHFGVADLVDDALAVLHESGVGAGPLLRDLRADRPGRADLFARAIVKAGLGSGHGRVPHFAKSTTTHDMLDLGKVARLPLPRITSHPRRRQAAAARLLLLPAVSRSGIRQPRFPGGDGAVTTAVVQISRRAQPTAFPSPMR